MDDDETAGVDVFRDGKLHVLDAKCKTCIFRSVRDGRIMLRPGRVAGMVLDARARDSVIPCHTTVWETDEPAVCRGFWDLPHKGGLLQVAERLGVVVYVPAPKE